MASPKICATKAQKGITLIEILVVLGLLAIIGSFGLIMSMDTLRGNGFRNEQDTLVSALQRARNLAMNNMCFGSGCTEGQPHGVHIEADPGSHLVKSYTVFQGTYVADDNLNETIAPADNTIFLNATSTAEVVFGQLSGNVSPEVDITINDKAGHTSTVHVNSEGQISWTN